MRVRWGILGCGNIATYAMAPAIRWSSNSELVAIASRDQHTADTKARELQARRGYGSYDALLADPEIEAVYIGLPNGLHELWALRAAEAGKHLLCEKSLTLSAAGTARLVEDFQKRKLRLVEAFMYRHHPQWNTVRSLLANGTIGRIRSMRAGLFGRLDRDEDHRWSPELGGGALFDVTCYGVDAARFLLDAEPQKVVGMAEWHSSGVDASTHALLTFPDGIIATVAGSLASGPDQHLVILGTEGTLSVPLPFVPAFEPTHVRIFRGGREERIHVNGANHFLHQVEHFANLIRNPTQSTAPAEAGLENAAVCDAIRKSSRSGKLEHVERF